MKPLPSFTNDLIDEMDRTYIGRVGDLSPHVDVKKLWMLIGQRKLIDALKRRRDLSTDIENELDNGVQLLIKEGDGT